MLGASRQILRTDSIGWGGTRLSNEGCTMEVSPIPAKASSPISLHQEHRWGTQPRPQRCGTAKKTFWVHTAAGNFHDQLWGKKCQCWGNSGPCQEAVCKARQSGYSRWSPMCRVGRRVSYRLWPAYSMGEKKGTRAAGLHEHWDLLMGKKQALDVSAVGYDQRSLNRRLRQ